MKFLKIYRSVKDVFVKPKFKWYFGSWRKEYNLPVWRRGPSISLSKNFGYRPNTGKYYSPVSRVEVFDGYVDSTYDKIRSYSWSDHKLPNGLNPWKDYVWHRDIRKKLKKWHLSWIPPVIQLPIWMSFHFFDSDIWWKTKYDDYSYEYPAHITWVLFGLALSVTAYIPGEHSTSNDDYWESILYYRDLKDLQKVHDIMGRWHTLKDDIYYNRFRPEFLKEPYRSQLIQIQNDPQASEQGVN